MRQLEEAKVQLERISDENKGIQIELRDLKEQEEREKRDQADQAEQLKQFSVSSHDLEEELKDKQELTVRLEQEQRALRTQIKTLQGERDVLKKKADES